MSSHIESFLKIILDDFSENRYLPHHAMSKSQKIDVSFNTEPEQQKLYRRIKSTKPKKVKLAAHAREVLRKGLDCTCDTKLVPTVKKAKRNAGDGQ